MRRQTLAAVVWTLFETVVRQVLLLAFTIVLARILTPQQFGVVALLTLFVGISQALVEGGLGSALVQSPKLTQTDISTVFWLQIGLGALLALVMAALGPLLAIGFDEPLLAPMAAAFGVNILISAPASVQTALATKALNFRIPVVVALVSQLVAGVAAVVAALQHAGAWAIVIQSVVASALTTVLLWVCLPWRPSFAFSRQSARRLFSFGIFVTGAGILGEIENRSGSLFVGKAFGTADAGQYQRAMGLQVILARTLSGVVTKVAFPAFAAVQNDSARLISALREAIYVNLVVTGPIMWGTALVSLPLVKMAFGDVWAPSAPALAAFCLAGGFYPIFAVSTKAQRAVGRSRQVFWIYAVRALGTVAVIAPTAHLGFVWMAWAQAVFGILCLSINCYLMSRDLGYRLGEQLKDLWPIMASGLAMAIAGFGAMSLSGHLPNWGQIIAIGSASVLAYGVVLAACTILAPSPASRRALQTLQGVFSRR